MVDKIKSFSYFYDVINLTLLCLHLPGKSREKGQKCRGSLPGTWWPAHAHRKLGTNFHVSWTSGWLLTLWPSWESSSTNPMLVFVWTNQNPADKNKIPSIFKTESDQNWRQKDQIFWFYSQLHWEKSKNSIAIVSSSKPTLITVLSKILKFCTLWVQNCFGNLGFEFETN